MDEDVVTFLRDPSLIPSNFDDYERCHRRFKVQKGLKGNQHSRYLHAVLHVLEDRSGDELDPALFQSPYLGSNTNAKANLKIILQSNWKKLWTYPNIHLGLKMLPRIKKLN